MLAAVAYTTILYVAARRDRMPRLVWRGAVQPLEILVAAGPTAVTAAWFFQRGGAGSGLAYVVPALVFFGSIVLLERWSMAFLRRHSRHARN